MGVRGANTFPSRNRLPYPFSLVVRPLFCFVVCWHSLPFQDKYVSGDSVNFRGSDSMEAVLPIEIQIPSLRIMKEANLDEDDWIQTRLDQINLIDEKRLAAICHGQLYQKRMI